MLESNGTVGIYRNREECPGGRHIRLFACLAGTGTAALLHMVTLEDWVHGYGYGYGVHWIRTQGLGVGGYMDGHMIYA